METKCGVQQITIILSVKYCAKRILDSNFNSAVNKISHFHEIAPNFIYSQKLLFFKYKLELLDQPLLPYKFYGRDIMGIFFFSILPVVSRMVKPTFCSLVVSFIFPPIIRSRSLANSSSLDVMCLVKNSLLGTAGAEYVGEYVILLM